MNSLIGIQWVIHMQLHMRVRADPKQKNRENNWIKKSESKILNMKVNISDFIWISHDMFSLFIIFQDVRKQYNCIL